MKIRAGLNPYGLTYTLGLQGRGTDRENPDGRGLEGFIDLAVELNSQAIEIWEGWLTPLSDDELKALKQKLDGLGLTSIMSSGLQTCDFDTLVRLAKALDSKLIRLALTPILCGDRAAAGDRWYDLINAVRSKLAAYAPVAEANGLTIVIENHQDFTSRELVGWCDEFGPAVRVVYDTGNSFPVAEAPLDFTRVIAPYVRHVHLKDYNVQWTDEGLRLVRCAIGDGAVPFRELFEILADHQPDLTCVLEPGALEARHVRLFTPGWWKGYAPKQAEELAACLLAARTSRLPDDADWQTPWEKGEDDRLVEYEMAMIRKSVANMKQLGIM